MASAGASPPPPAGTVLTDVRLLASGIVRRYIPVVLSLHVFSSLLLRLQDTNTLPPSASECILCEARSFHFLTWPQKQLE